MNHDEYEIPETSKLEVPHIHGSTEVHLRELSYKERTMDLHPGDTRRKRYVARVGLPGAGDTMLELCRWNPFHPRMNGGYAEGRGNTIEDAVAGMTVEYGNRTKIAHV